MVESCEEKAGNVAEWYYTEGDEPKGPVSRSELITLCETGKLEADALVWREGLETWTAAQNIDGLMPHAGQPPPFPLGRGIEEYAASGDQIRPWVRFGARGVDTLLFNVCAIFFSGAAILIEPLILDFIDTLVATIVWFLAYAVVEAAVLAIWGTTPGKALLRVRLRNSDGSRLCFGDALGRAFNLRIKGLAFGIPILSLITLIISYRRLTNKGITPWDADGDFVVTHQ